jgi:DNA-binding MarR family transcriptional regulator
VKGSKTLLCGVTLTEKGEKFLLDGKENTKRDYKNLFADFSSEEIYELAEALGEIHKLQSRI